MKGQNAMARPTKYTDATVARICEAIRTGATFELAAHYGGISYETFRVWMDEKPAFSENVTRAQADGAMPMLEMIRQAAPADWRAAGWWLEHVHPQSYGKAVTEGKISHEHSGPEGAPIAINYFDAAAAIDLATTPFGSGDDSEGAD